ncbi:MAG TPA: hypothetical protein PL124_00900 [Candidatus Cloacimonadota bacterium]|nr:hypothetical protein [Candidatus Cloacimonadota bacterium]HPS37949.1 hypothetical protein [Candidatus Cloacimonadota bacterium]
MNIKLKTLFRYLLILSALTFLWGCNLTLTHDIVFTSPDSGTVVITAEVMYETFSEDAEPPSEDNPLHEYVEFAEELWGITVTDETTQDLSDPDNAHYIYTVSADFDDSSELGVWLGIQDSPAVEVTTEDEVTTVNVFPQLLQLNSEEILNQYIGDYSLMDIEALFNITVPGYINLSDSSAEITQDGHTARWKTVIDENYFSGDDITYSISY